MVRVLIWLVALAAALGMSSCTRSIDVWIANPCPRALKVVTYDVPPERIADEVPNAVAVAPPGISKIDKAFTNAAGRRWTVEIGEGPDRVVLPVDGDLLSHSTLTLPATVCNTKAP